MSNMPITQQLEEYKQLHPVITETMYAFREVQTIYIEALQIMQESELALCCVSTSDKTEEIQLWTKK